MVERLDADFGGAAEFLERPVGEFQMPGHGEVRAIDLQQEAGVVDRLVFVGQRLAERHHIVVAGLIEGVGHEMGDDTRRGGIHEGAGRRCLVHRSAIVGEVGFQRRRYRPARSARGRPAGPGSAAWRSRTHAGGVTRMGQQVRRHPAQRLRLAEAVQPVLDIVGVGNFRHLAIADDVDAALDLFLHDFRHRFGYEAFQQGRIVGPVAVLRDEQVDQVVRPRQAADMGGQDAVGGEGVRTGGQNSISPYRRRCGSGNTEAVQRFKPERGRCAFAGRRTEWRLRRARAAAIPAAGCGRQS